MGTATTSASATATAYGNQRKTDRAQNGVLWSWVSYQGSTNGYLSAAYATDNGVSWTQAADVQAFGGAGYVGNVSAFIDLDDYAHLAYKNMQDGYIYYRRGTPNAARTAYTWSAAFRIGDTNKGDPLNYPDVVAHRDPANPGAWVAHVVYDYGSTNAQQKVFYTRVSITSGGALSASAEVLVAANLAAANTIPAFPSIDFNHTGDGKTVAGGTPHLYVGWSAGATGAGYGIRFRKATYASGSWTWGTEREIDPTRYVINSASWLNCLFDGTRVVLIGSLFAGSAHNVVVYDRDAADTVTTTVGRVVLTGGASTDLLLSGSASYNAAGDVILLGRDGSGSSDADRNLVWRRWIRATGVLSTATTFDATGRQDPYVSARRGPQGQAIDYVHTDGTASPYEVKSGRIVLNQNPTAPTPVSPTDNATWDSATDQTVTFKHNDPDGDAASAYRLSYRPAGTSVAYQVLEGSTTAANGANVAVTVPANTWPGQIEYFSQTLDASGAISTPSPLRVVTGVPAALAALTGGAGGTSASPLDLYSQAQSERALRALNLV